MGTTGISINAFKFKEEPVFLGGKRQRTIKAAAITAAITTTSMDFVGLTLMTYKQADVA
jgi:hypothetical protein